MNKIMLKGVIFAIIALYVGMNIIPLTGGLITEEKISIDYAREEYRVTNKDRASTTSTHYVGSKQPPQILIPRWFSVPTTVKRGDIAFCEHRPWSPGYRTPGCHSNDHALMYIGNNRFIESCPYLPWLYYGSKGWDLCKIGVVKTHIGYLKLWATDIIYGTVINASESQKDAAVKWAESQRGHPYQFGYEPPWPYHKHVWWGCPNTNGTTYNPDTGTYFKEEYYDYWYCTELIWAAYKHCDGDSGIDIKATWSYDKNDDSWHWWIGPDEMLANVDQIYLYTDGDYGNPGNCEPIVESYNVNASTNSATLHGKLIDDGKERCHCYLTLIDVGNGYCGFYKSESIETFSYSFRHLKPGTTYQWYAWAYNSIGKAKGETKNFTTLSSSI